MGHKPVHGLHGQPVAAGHLKRRVEHVGHIVHQCGLKNAYSYDLEAACAGFLVALQDGAAYIKSGLRKKVIVVAAEKMTSMVDYTDRTTCALFGYPPFSTTCRCRGFRQEDMMPARQFLHSACRQTFSRKN